MMMADVVARPALIGAAKVGLRNFVTIPGVSRTGVVHPFDWAS